jgi:hypothetical protein
MNGNGARAKQLQIDWPELVRFKRTFTEPAPKKSEAGFAKAEIRETPTSNQTNLRCMPGLLNYGYLLMLQKNPEAESVRNQQ